MPGGSAFARDVIFDLPGKLRVNFAELAADKLADTGHLRLGIWTALLRCTRFLSHG
jgi:hypothetical protein